MLLFKACARCHGDMQTSRDLYGDYKLCLQCGMTVDIERENDALVALLKEPRKAEPARAKKKVA